MVKEKQIKIADTLQRLLKEKGLHLYKIVIFGSQIKGNAGKDSDIDILILSKSFEGKDIFERIEMTMGIHRELVRELEVPVDIMYYSLSEWNKGSSLILRLAKKEGVAFDVNSRRQDDRHYNKYRQGS